MKLALVLVELMPAVLLVLAVVSQLSNLAFPPPRPPPACTDCPLLIPRIIHQTYKTADLPAAWKTTPQQWKKHHPGWRYMLWTDDDNRRLIATNYSWFLPTYDAYPHGIQRADAARYFILHRFGGVYADMDVQPVRSIEDMVRGVTAAVGATPNLGVTNAFMVSVANSSFFNFVASSLPAHASRWYHVTRHWEILTSTGPTFLWKQLSQYGGPETVSVIPASVWGKCSICASQCPLVSKAYFRHLTGDSWHAWDSTLMTYGFFCHPNLTTFAAAFLVFLLAGWPHVVQHVHRHRQAVVIFWLTCVVLSVGSLDLTGLMLVFTLANLRRNIAAGPEPVHEKS